MKYTTLATIFLSQFIFLSSVMGIAADNCEDATELTTDTPNSCEDGENFLSVVGSIDLASSEILTECGHNLGPTVWYQINIDDPDANALITQVDAPGFDVVWSLYQGTSCADMVAVSEPVQPGEPALPCSDSDGDESNTYSIAIADVVIGTPYTYWIAITAIGGIDDPNFTLNYASSLGCMACSGTASTDCSNGDFAAFVDGVPSNGPFCQGDEVLVCLDFTYDATATGNDWMHGIIPNFGPGWDIEASDLGAVNVGGNFEWFEADGPCAPMLNGYTLPNVCTYTDSDGRLKLCNVACNPNCPCTAPLVDGSPLPSGWFTNSTGGSSTCNTLGCSPASFFGIPGGVFVQISICIPLKVKIFEPGECEDNKGLRISIQTTSDAISGCWEDNSPCIIYPSFQGPDWEIECDTPPDPIAEQPWFICSGDAAGLVIQTEDGSVHPIEVTVEDNTDVDGEGTGSGWIGNVLTINGGFGTLDDVLINTTGIDQIVTYKAQVVSSDFSCPGSQVEFEVTVHPELMVTLEASTDILCQVECTDLSTMVVGGTGVYTDYLWSTGELDPIIEVCPGPVTIYSVTVTDDAGCTGTATVEVMESFIFDAGDDFLICQDGIFNSANPEFIVVPMATQGDGPFNWNYTPEQGLEGFAILGGNEWVIDEESSMDIEGDGLELCIVGVNQFGCTFEDCVTIFLFEPPSIDIIESPVVCGVPEFCFMVESLFPNGDPIPNLIIRSCDGVPLFEEDFSNTGIFNPGCFDLNEYSCFEIVAFDDASGCEITVELTKIFVSGTDIIVDDVEVCDGESATVTVTNAAAYTTFVWTAAGSTTVLGTSASYTFTPDSTTILFIETSDSVDCIATETVMITKLSEEELPNSDFKFFVSGNEVTFTYQGSEYTELRWEFGDGATSIEENPTHVYDTEGPFGASLFVTNPCGQDASTQTILIVTAGFNISQATSGCAPYMVTYMDASSTNVDTWNWTFEGGDITTSTDQNPIVQYMTAGAYDVQLEVFATTGTDIRVMTDYIMVLDVPVPDFDTEVSERSVDLTYTGGAYDAISWDFGDGSTSTEENPEYTYTENGTYTIILTTTNECGSTAREHEVTVMSVGTEDIETLSFDLFPNPAKDYIVIETSVTSGNVEVVDVSGKLWMSTSISSELTLDTSHLPVGTYILKITDAHQVAAYKKLEIVR